MEIKKTLLEIDELRCENEKILHENHELSSKLDNIVKSIGRELTPE